MGLGLTSRKACVPTGHGHAFGSASPPLAFQQEWISRFPPGQLKQRIALDDSRKVEETLNLGSTDVIFTGIRDGSTFANPQTERQSFDRPTQARNSTTDIPSIASPLLLVPGVQEFAL